MTEPRTGLLARAYTTDAGLQGRPRPGTRACRLVTAVAAAASLTLAAPGRRPQRRRRARSTTPCCSPRTAGDGSAPVPRQRVRGTRLRRRRRHHLPVHRPRHDLLRPRGGPGPRPDAHGLGRDDREHAEGPNTGRRRGPRRHRGPGGRHGDAARRPLPLQRARRGDAVPDGGPVAHRAARGVQPPEPLRRPRSVPSRLHLPRRRLSRTERVRVDAPEPSPGSSSPIGLRAWLCGSTFRPCRSPSSALCRCRGLQDPSPSPAPMRAGGARLPEARLLPPSA